MAFGLLADCPLFLPHATRKNRGKRKKGEGGGEKKRELGLVVVGPPPPSSVLFVHGFVG